MEDKQVKVYDRRGHQYLVRAEYPALWTKHQSMAGVFAATKIAALKQTWPYLANCDLLPVVHVETTNERETYMEEVIGWRAWEIHTLGKLVRLGSVTATAHWPVADWVYAECGGERFCTKSSDGRVPGENCSCGLYAARSLEHLTDELPYANYDDTNGGSIRVLGQVAMAGKVIVGTQGWKAEKARVFHIYVPHNHWKLGREIARQYNVPYDTLRWIGGR